MDSLATTIERWNEYGRDYAVHPWAWDGSLACAFGPLGPEGATMRDQSGRTQGAIWSVGAGDVPKYVQSSYRGRAFWAGSFDGTDDYASGSAAPFSTESFSITAWVNPASVGRYAAVYDTRDAGTKGWLFGYRDGDSSQKMSLYFSNGLQAAEVLGLSALQAGQWSCVSATINRSTSTISHFKNGNADGGGSIASVAGTVGTSVPASIGWHSAALSSAWTYWIGGLCMLMTHSRVLTPNEIATFARGPLEAYLVNVPQYFFAGVQAGFRGPIVGSRIIRTKPSPMFIRGA